MAKTIISHVKNKGQATPQIMNVELWFINTTHRQIKVNICAIVLLKSPHPWQSYNMDKKSDEQKDVRTDRQEQISMLEIIIRAVAIASAVTAVWLRNHCNVS